MTPRPANDQSDLHDTVMIPVLTLRSAPHTAGTGQEHADATGSSAARRPAPADAVCEQVLREAAATMTIYATSNALLAAAMPLIVMAIRLRSAAAPVNPQRLSQLLTESVREFDNDVMHRNVRHEIALVARYILCCTVDESVLLGSWGVASGWAHRSLLRTFHNEANGGARFFTLLDHALLRPHDCRDLLELFYVCLSMGFEGRLHFDPAGRTRIDMLRQQLSGFLYTDPAPASARSNVWGRSVLPVQKPPLWRGIALLTLALAIGYGGLRLSLDSLTQSAVEQVQQALHITGMKRNRT
jgi:type VI secretion system protein ImpK